MSPIRKQRSSGSGIGRSSFKKPALSLFKYHVLAPCESSLTFPIRPSQASAAVTCSSPHTMSLSRPNKLVSSNRQSHLSRQSPGEDSWEGIRGSVGAGQSQHFGRKPRDTSSRAVSDGPCSISLISCAWDQLTANYF